MKENWKSNPKYAEGGINGSLCSILVYLSEVSKLRIMLGEKGVSKHNFLCPLVALHSTKENAIIFSCCELDVLWLLRRRF